MAGSRRTPARRVPRYACLRRDEFTGQRRHFISCAAVALDHQVVQRVAAALSPVPMRAALEAIESEHGRFESGRRARRHELTRLQDTVEELKAQLRHLGADREVLRNELEDDLQRMITRRRELSFALAREETSTPVITMADAAELVALTSRFEVLWSAPTTSNADRKRLLRTVLRRVEVKAPAEGAVEEKLDAAIEWIGGFRETCSVLRPKGILGLAVGLRRRGRSTKEITADFAAAGMRTRTGRLFTRKVLQHRLWDGGFNTKDDRVAALRLIHAMLVDHRSRREILERLHAEGPKPKEGEWTSGRLTNAITSLKRGSWAADVPSLPAGMSVLRRLPPEVIEIIRQGRAQQPPRTFEAIAAELNALGYRTPRDRAFTMMNLYQLWHHLQADAARDARATSRSAPEADAPDADDGAAAAPCPRPPRRPTLHGSAATVRPPECSLA